MKITPLYKVLFTAGLYLLAFGLAQLDILWLEPNWDKLILIFGALSLTLALVERRLTKLLPEQAAMLGLVMITVHLFGCLLIALFWRFWGPPYDTRFVLNFFVIYVAFLMFEVLSLLYNLRPLSNESQ
jgi:hypothetical protein